MSALNNPFVVTGNNGGTAGGSANYIKMGNIVISYGLTAAITANAGAQGTGGVTFPVTYATAPVVNGSLNEETGTAKLIGHVNNAPSTTAVTVDVQNVDSINGTGKIGWIAIGTV